MFKERLLKFEPFNLGHFVVDIRQRDLEYWELRTSLGSVLPPISLRSRTVKALALSSSSKLPMLSMVNLDAALQETLLFMSFS